MSKVAIAPLKFVLVWCLWLILLPAGGQAAGLSSKLANDIVLVLDNSGSMRKNDKNVVTKQVATQFIKDAAANSHLGILIFDTNVKFAFRLAPATGASREALLSSLDNLDFHGRWTNMPAALSQAMAELKTNGRDSATKSIVLLTDGVVETGNAERDREDSQALRRILASDAAANGVKIYTVAMGPKADTELLQVLANQTFADYYWVGTGDDLPPVFDRIHGTISRDVRAPVNVAKLATPAVTVAPGTVPAGAKTETVALTTVPVPAIPEPVRLQKTATPPAATQHFDVGTTKRQERIPAGAGRYSVDSVPAAVPGPGANGSQAENAAHWSWTVGGLLLLVGVLTGLLLRSGQHAPTVVHQSAQAERGPGGPVPPRSAQAQRAPQAFLQDMTGVSGRPRHELDNAVTVIGRLAPHPDDPFGHIVIDQPTIGRRHSVIERRQHGFWISDQHSKNGTFVNDQRITDEVSLAHGDRVRFHEYDFEFFLAGWGLVDETVSVSDLRLVSNKRPEANG